MDEEYAALEAAAAFADEIEKQRGLGIHGNRPHPVLHNAANQSHQRQAAGPELSSPIASSSSVFATYIFPRSDEYATREYQKNIVANSLLKNTMVVLPTGLGKTFIAAVVMFNYLRWFPEGKIIFMAPTRPLVNQQIQACHDVVGISEEETAEMNGMVSSAKRERLWQEKRVFYCTPQTAEKDLESNIMPREKISLVVVDEAHRAVGKYAFVNVVQNIYQSNKKFRVLALSATPGKDYGKVQDVVSNLMISNIEYKSETDFDVRPYVFQKMMDVVHCQMNPRCLALLEEFNKFIDVPLRRLKASGQCPALTGSAKDLSSFQVVHMLNAVGIGSNLSAGQLSGLRAELGLLSSLVHIRTLMVTHGLSSALSHIKTHFEGDLKGGKKALVCSPEWKQLLVKLNDALMKGGANPKISKLKEILLEHFERFKEAEKTTSVIVFAQYRDSVVEIVQDLKAATSLRVSPFVGQAKSKTPETENSEEKKRGKSLSPPVTTLAAAASEWNKIQPSKAAAAAVCNGQTQKEQQEVVRKFRAGLIDVLVATCIGEEGLDIGSVDLIVSYDALQSPVRMIQRFGRAGRKRAGKIIVLVADDKEKQMLTNGTKMSASVHKLLRENMWKIKLFRPPAEACMFPDPNGRPSIEFKKLDIGQYRGENVGGHSNQKKRKKDLLPDELDDEAVTGAEPLTLEELSYLQQRFGLTLDGMSANPLITSERSFSLSNFPDYGLPSSLLVSKWRSFSQAYLAGASSRTHILQRTCRFVEFELWRDDSAYAFNSADAREPGLVSVPKSGKRDNSSDFSQDTEYLLKPVLGIRRRGTDVAMRNVRDSSDYDQSAANEPCERGGSHATQHVEGNLSNHTHKDHGEQPSRELDEMSAATIEDTRYQQVTVDVAAVVSQSDCEDDVPLPPAGDEWNSQPDVVNQEMPPATVDQEYRPRVAFAVSPDLDVVAAPALTYDAPVAAESQTPTLARRSKSMNKQECAKAIESATGNCNMPSNSTSPMPAEQIQLISSINNNPMSVNGEDAIEIPRQKKPRVLIMPESSPDESRDSSPRESHPARKRKKMVTDEPSPEEAGDESQAALEHHRRERKERKVLIRDKFFSVEAQLEGASNESEDDPDGSDLDKDLESFIDDESLRDENGESIVSSQGEYHRHHRFSMKSSPMDGIVLKPGQRTNLNAMPVITKTLMRLRQKMELGLPMSPDEDDEDGDDFGEEDDEDESNLASGSRGGDEVPSSQESPSDILRKPSAVNPVRKSLSPIPVVVDSAAAPKQHALPQTVVPRKEPLLCVPQANDQPLSAQTSSARCPSVGNVVQTQGNFTGAFRTSIQVVEPSSSSFAHPPLLASTKHLSSSIPSQKPSPLLSLSSPVSVDFQKDEKSLPRNQVPTASSFPGLPVQQPPTTTSAMHTTTSQVRLSEEARLRIEENRKLALLKLQEKQQQLQMGPSKLGSSREHSPPIIEASNLGSASAKFVQDSTPTPSNPPSSLSSVQPRQHVGSDVRPSQFNNSVEGLSVLSPSMPSKPQEHSRTSIWFDQRSPALQHLQRIGGFLPLSNSSTSQNIQFRSSPHLVHFHGVDMIVSFRLGLKILFSLDVLDLEHMAEAQTQLNRTLQRYTEIALVLVIEDKQELLYNARLRLAVNQLRLWSPSVRLFVVAKKSLPQQDFMHSIVASLTSSEQRAGRTCPNDVSEILADVQKGSVLEFLSRARDCNMVIAASILSYFKGRTVGEMIYTISKDLLCQAITPGLSPPQATKIALFFKRLWKCD